MRILLWHVHGSWTDAFVRGNHSYVLPVTPDRGPDGRGRARTWRWPSSVVERTPEQLRHEPIDVVLLQRPHEQALATRWLGRTPPAIYLEHNTPGGDVPRTRHPYADQDVMPIVHVTYFNQLFWDTGTTRAMVIEHGIVDPGPRYTGELPRAAVAINDPVRRGRAVGTDLLEPLGAAVDTDVFGMNVTPLSLPGVRTYEDLPQHQLHAALARRRVYVHTPRWTSLGLSLLEAMHLGMPVVALATTEVVRAVPPEAGVATTNPAELVAAARDFVTDLSAARRTGAAARQAALRRYGLRRFLAEWDAVLDEVVRAPRRRSLPVPDLTTSGISGETYGGGVAREP